MKHSLNDIDLIERYFEQKLTDAEVRLVEDRLERDSEFQMLFHQEKILINAIRFQATQQNLQFLKAVERSLEQNKVNYFKQYWHYFAAAACVGLIALALLIPSGKETPDELFAANFKPHPNIYEPTLRGHAALTPRAQAFQAYDQGDYRRAAELFSSLLKENKQPEILMLLGNSNLMLEKTVEAEANLKDLLTNYNDFDLEAKWYLALCYLKTGDLEQARHTLQDVAGSENSYTVRARELLNKLR